MNMYDVVFDHDVEVSDRGTITAPPAHGPMMQLICGTTRRKCVCAKRYRRNTKTNDAFLNTRAAGIIQPMIGAPTFIARSITLQIFSACVSEGNRQTQ